jgi:hypothetical protein
VLSHDLPDEVQEYYNRLALMKEQGAAMALVSPEDEGFLADIEVNMKAEIEEKIIEGFIETDTPVNTKKNREKKPRHSKSKVKKDKEA